MGKFKIRAFQLQPGHFDGTASMPEWAQGLVRPYEFDGTVGKVENIPRATHWIVNVGDWVVFHDPSFVIAADRVFHEHYEAA